MGALTRLAAGLLLVAATPAAAEPLDLHAPHIAEAARRFGIPADWIERVMRAESGGRTTLRGEPIVSRAGAMGLMQLMPGTWAEMRNALGLGGDPHAPRDNILAGTYYLRLLHDRFGYPGLFAAYNAGPARYAAYLAGRSRLPSETRSYLAAVAGSAATRTPLPAVPSVSPPLFFVRANRASPPSDAQSLRAVEPRGSGLFLIAPQW